MLPIVAHCCPLLPIVAHSAMIYIIIDCHILPLTGLNASVYTGLNAQAISGWMDGCVRVWDGMGMEISVSTSSKSTARWC